MSKLRNPRKSEIIGNPSLSLPPEPRKNNKKLTRAPLPSLTLAKAEENFFREISEETTRCSVTHACGL